MIGPSLPSPELPAVVQSCCKLPPLVQVQHPTVAGVVECCFGSQPAGSGPGPGPNSAGAGGGKAQLSLAMAWQHAHGRGRSSSRLAILCSGTAQLEHGTNQHGKLSFYRRFNTNTNQLRPVQTARRGWGPGGYSPTTIEGQISRSSRAPLGSIVGAGDEGDKMMRDEIQAKSKKAKKLY